MVVRQAEAAIIIIMGMVIQYMIKLTKVFTPNYLPDCLNTIIMFIMQKKGTGLGVFKTVVWLKNPPIF